VINITQKTIKTMKITVFVIVVDAFGDMIGFNLKI